MPHSWRWKGTGHRRPRQVAAVAAETSSCNWVVLVVICSFCSMAFRGVPFIFTPLLVCKDIPCHAQMETRGHPWYQSLKVTYTFAWSSLSGLGWLASEPRSACLHICSTDFTSNSLHMGSEGLNSGSHAFMESTLSTELPFQPLSFMCLYHDTHTKHMCTRTYTLGQRQEF